MGAGGTSRMTATVRLEVKGLKEALSGLAATPRQVRAEMGMAMAKALLAGHDFIAKYPAAIPGSTYVRTGNLGGDWSVNINHAQTTVRGFLINTMPYGRYVQDLERQAAVHQGRWRTIQELGKGNVAAYLKSFFKKVPALLVARFGRV